MNLYGSLGLLVLLAMFVAFILIYGVWRNYKARNAVEWSDYEASGYCDNLYEDSWFHHPFRTSIYLLAYICRQVAYAWAIVYMVDDPVFQLFVLIGSSILYNCVIAMAKPFYSRHNMVLHYFNEFSFFFFITMCMTFTDFVTDRPTRSQTARVLVTFQYVVYGFNALVCLFSMGYQLRGRFFQKPKAKVEIASEITLA